MFTLTSTSHLSWMRYFGGKLRSLRLQHHSLYTFSAAACKSKPCPKDRGLINNGNPSPKWHGRSPAFCHVNGLLLPDMTLTASQRRSLHLGCTHLTIGDHPPRENRFVPRQGFHQHSSDRTRVEAIREHAFSYKTFEDHLFDILAEPNGKVHLSKLLSGLKNTGLWKSDPRLKESMDKIRETMQAVLPSDIEGKEILLDRETFKECIKDNIVLIRRAFTSEFVVPEFSKFCSMIDDVYWMCRTNTSGKVANYIPQLSRYSADIWGVSLCTIDGQRHSIGDVALPFSMQSCSKPINYALAVNDLGLDTVHEFVGHEPHGETINNINLGHHRIPHNPMINAGAIVVASLIKNSMRLADRFDYVSEQYKKLTGGGHLGFNNAIFLSERESADRNFALGYYLKENRCFPDGVNLHETMDFYFQLCSIEVTCESGAVLAATLANGGYCPITGEHVLDTKSVRNTLALMHSCGMYDYSGEFAFKVGLPAKSGVSGLVLLVIPNVCGMAIWSPPLDSTGNSVRGIQFCEELVQLFNFHHYDNLKHTVQKYDPCIRRSDVQGSQVVKLLFGAYNGDLTALRRMALAEQDMSIADYDGRTALHLAAAEGKLDCVKFLLDKCSVPPNPKDRWGHTPLDDAVHFQRSEVARCLENHLAENPDKALAFKAVPTSEFSTLDHIDPVVEITNEAHMSDNDMDNDKSP